MSVYVWADTHFNHRGIIKYASRPYGSAKEMNAALVEKWNERVGPRDEVWLLGDFGFVRGEGDDLRDIFFSLKGKKHLVVGNHDEKNPQVLRLPWQSMSALRTLKLGGNRAELCHYPLETWKKSWSGAMMLHGHCHGTLFRKLPKRFDVGVDTEIGRDGPILWEQLVALSAAEQFAPVDGHTEKKMEDAAEVHQQE